MTYVGIVVVVVDAVIAVVAKGCVCRSFVLSNILSNQICNLADSTQYALVRLGPAALNLYSTLRIFGLRQHFGSHFVFACPVGIVISWYFIVGNAVSLR